MTPADIRKLADELRQSDTVGECLDKVVTAIKALRALADVVEAIPKCSHMSAMHWKACRQCQALARLEALKP